MVEHDSPEALKPALLINYIYKKTGVNKSCGSHLVLVVVMLYFVMHDAMVFIGIAPLAIKK